jgi:hypothetical protein
MRDYLYLWHQPSRQRIVFSGLEFRDILPAIEACDVLLLLRSEYGDAEHDRASGFDFVHAEDLTDLANDDIDGYGDFCWVDVHGGADFSSLIDESIAEATFFAHTRRPLRNVSIPGLSNSLLWWSHDGAWYVSLFYSQWQVVESTLRSLLSSFVSRDEVESHVRRFVHEEGAWWCQPGAVASCEATEDIDALLARRRPRS